MKSNLTKLHKMLSLYISFSEENPKNCKILHDIRVSARKLINTTHPDKYLAISLKKLIQSSNKIRDLDVFLNDIVPMFSKKLLADLSKTQLTLSEYRIGMNHDFKTLLSDELIHDIELASQHSVPDSEINTDLNRHQMPLTDIDKRLKKATRELHLLDLEDKQFHKIRLVIKRLHYQLERFYPEERTKIELTKRIQNKLGYFHDFYQAKKILKNNKTLIKPKTFKSCIEFLEDKKNQSIKDLRKDIQKRQA